ncbi:MAG: phosphatidate cytidylyltransferase [Peptostreptococcaceae bacterium]|nr:phosphatidate cytidylyltransferase [Peptostreptococcaceae bacterium]
MLKRTLSALFLLPFLFFIIIKGGIFLYLASSIISIVALKEFYEIFNKKYSIKYFRPISYIVCILFLYFNYMKFDSEKIFGVLFLIFLIIVILSIKEKHNILENSIFIFGLIYIPFFLNHIIFILDSSYKNYIWFVFINAWATDTFAYFCGFFFGKHKLIPRISPKKTVEGAIGGILGSVLISMLYGHYFEINLIHCFFIGCLGSLVAQLGDLFASSIKRFMDIKDYGTLIPGHGGILDRFDSILLTAPFVYYYIKIFIA